MINILQKFYTPTFYDSNDVHIPYHLLYTYGKFIYLLNNHIFKDFS